MLVLKHQDVKNNVKRGTESRPFLDCGCEGCAGFILRICVCCTWSGSMGLTHRKTAVMATPSRGCQAWPAVQRQTLVWKPYFTCVCRRVHAQTFFLRACLSVVTAKKPRQRLTWQLSLLSVQLFLVGSLLCDTIFPYDHLFINGDWLLLHIRPALLKVYQLSLKLIFSIN